jgi:drug/metabolite transporter (DMT)-like permease
MGLVTQSAQEGLPSRPMVIVVSLMAAALYGSGDFCGALAARRATATQVVAGSHVVGLVGVTAVALLVAEGFTGRDLALGGAGGVFGGIGVGLLYRRLAEGPMYVVAPLTAITAAALPAAWGARAGEELSALAWVGVALALAAVGLVSAATPGVGSAPVTTRVVVESLLSGCGFGAFFILLGVTDEATAPWPVVGARLTTSVALLAFLAGTGRQLVPPDTPSRLLIAATGLLEIGANVGFLYAATRGQLAVASVLTSLYPVVTVVLARLLLDERMTRIQLLGVAGALGATGLISAG